MIMCVQSLQRETHAAPAAAVASYVQDSVRDALCLTLGCVCVCFVLLLRVDCEVFSIWGLIQAALCSGCRGKLRQRSTLWDNQEEWCPLACSSH